MSCIKNPHLDSVFTHKNIKQLVPATANLALCPTPSVAIPNHHSVRAILHCVPIKTCDIFDNKLN